MLYLIPATTNLLNFLARWEFYPFLPQKVYRVNLNRLAVDSFNSQWDEIYAPNPYKKRLYWWVRFQTGLNSTKFEIRSILLSFGFNSQRDGILHKTQVIKSTLKGLQFPTGWNSTIKSKLIYRLMRCFNSQRDGILPYHSRHKTARMKQFQFPTGWNSTKQKRDNYHECNVSIPNGMEFYEITILHYST